MTEKAEALGYKVLDIALRQAHSPQLQNLCLPSITYPSEVPAPTTQRPRRTRRRRYLSSFIARGQRRRKFDTLDYYYGDHGNGQRTYDHRASAGTTASRQIMRTLSNASLFVGTNSLPSRLTRPFGCHPQRDLCERHDYRVTIALC